MLRIAIGERVLVMWRNHLEGVPNALIDNVNSLFEGASDGALPLRRRFMRKGYVPRDVPEYATNASLEINDSIRIFNFTRSDSHITKGAVCHKTDEDNPSFTDDLSETRIQNNLDVQTQFRR